MFGRRMIAMLLAEFLGTAILAFTIVNVSHSTIGIPYFIAMAAGLVMALMGLGLGRDVHLNPALTIGLWTARQIKTTKAVAYIIVQLLGGWAAYALYKYFAQGHPVQSLPTAYDSHILVAEALGAFVFSFVLAGVWYQKLHWLARAVAAGGALSIGMIISAVGSAAFLNPAVALAANAWSWGTYVLGPVLGALIGVNLYGLVFAPADQTVPSKTSKISIPRFSKKKK